MLDFVMLDMRMYEMQYLDITLGTAYKKEFSYQQIQLHLLGDLLHNLPYLQTA
jgi:hypothetical protein